MKKQPPLFLPFLLISLMLKMNAAPILVFVGAYAGKPDEGISVYTMCDQSGKLTQTTVLGGQKNPSFVEVHPSGEFLYAVNEIGNFEGEKQGAVSAYSVDPKTGNLTLINQQPTKGASPCHISISKDGKSALIANYTGGSVASYRIGDDGKLSPPVSFHQHEGSSVNPGRQKGPHGHAINLDPSNQYAFASDLGLDKILIYKFDAKTSQLKKHGFATVAPGAGPRHFAISSKGKFAYSLNELHSTITSFAFDSKKGTLSPFQTISTLPTGYKGGNSTAEIKIHPNGKYLYSSNRGHDSIAVFKIHEKLGTLTPIQEQKTGGKTPRNFNITPNGKFLVAANQGSNDITVLKLDPQTGLLTPTSHRVETPRPVCIRFLELK
jgi:6-phosphogluconolactonase